MCITYHKPCDLSQNVIDFGLVLPSKGDTRVDVDYFMMIKVLFTLMNRC